MKVRNGVGTGAYPERQLTQGGWIDRSTARARVLVHGRWDLRTRYSWMLKGIGRHEGALRDLDAAALSSHGRSLTPELVRRGPTRALLPGVFAWLREVAARSLGVRHDDTQCLGAAAMLGGAFVELTRAEDRTLALGLAAATTVASGVPVELVHARADRALVAYERLRPFYEALGMSVAFVSSEHSREQKRAGYACDVTYVAGSQLVLDYLYDRVLLDGQQNHIQLRLDRLLHGADARLESLVLRGLRAAFADDADQLLVDDAQRPMTIADPHGTSELHLARVEGVRVARELQLGEHFTLDAVGFEVALTPSGEAAVDAATAGLSGAWRRPAWRTRMVSVALTCLHLWRRGVTHEVEAGGLQLLPEGAERLGDSGAELFPVLGLVEEVALAPAQDPLRRMSMPRLFQRYQRFAGAGAVLREVSGALGGLFAQPVVPVPRLSGHAPVFEAKRAFRSADERDLALIARLRAITDTGEAVLLGVREEDGARAWAERLALEGLDARAVELVPDGSALAGLLEDAGTSGRVTVLPARALRAAAVREPGRLHALRVEPLQSRRFDRLLYAHAQGSEVERPLESFVALDDPLLGIEPGQLKRSALVRFAKADGEIPEVLLRPFERRAQKNIERRHQDRMHASLRAEEAQEATLAFGGVHH